ncbi:MAG TPA: hypothetical protein VF600_14315 [Abditibacteriaceae bacterium]|jgi:hypothetical protein
MKTTPSTRFVCTMLPVLLAAPTVVHSTTPVLPVRVTSNPNDVMGGQRPKYPTFPKLAKKKGYLRGFARNVNGKPLQGVRILIASPSLGFSSSSQSVRTDARGYYEIKPMYGGCTVRSAGYTTSYRGKLYALPLHPVDGQIDSIDTNGEIENFVLLTYGPVSAAKADDNPEYTGAYYGAAFTFGYSTREATDSLAPRSHLLLDSTVEVTLTPDGPLLDGSKGRVLVIRKKITPRGYFPINDIPIGRYKIKVALVSEEGRPLKISEIVRVTGREAMTPNETTSEATIQFRSEVSDLSTLGFMMGGMMRHSLNVERVD